MLIQNLSKSKTLGENVIHSTQNIQFTSKCQKLMKYETLFYQISWMIELKHV